MARRAWGTGSLYTRTNKHGHESWYGQWRVDGRLVKRRVGSKGPPPKEMNRRAAEAALRDLMASLTLADLEPSATAGKKPGTHTIEDVWNAYSVVAGNRIKASTRVEYA